MAPPKNWRARFLASPRCAGAGTGSGSRTRSTTRGVPFWELFRQYGESVKDLEVRRASLENTYMVLVRQAEHRAPRGLTAVTDEPDAGSGASGPFPRPDRAERTLTSSGLTSSGSSSGSAPSSPW